MLTNNDWDKAGGAFCPACSQETVRFEEGLCPSCVRKKKGEEARAMEHIAMALTYRAKPRRPTSAF